MRIHISCSILISLLITCSCKLNKDFALSDSRDEWSHHFSFGSPSWDSFERLPDNPVYTGRDGFEWPVNGFLFSDPISKNWYLYIGEYRRYYNIVNDSGSKNFNCVIYKSTDKGKTWGKIGDLFPLIMKCFDSINIQVPDVMVIYNEGKYHMIFDWVSSDASWENNGKSGIGYAVADRPEGPFSVSEEPLKINTQYRNSPLLDRYWRMYAPMIVKRKDDWVMLYMMDTSPSRSWALVASASEKPEGPYSEPVFIKNVEQKTYYPPLMEYFPAFSHKGYVYFPATSVALNRNYQLINRVRTEDVMDPGKWETFSAGSFWHSINEDNEYAGIWGQTITGFIDDQDSLFVMYPSRNKENYGTINLAKTSWTHLNKNRGFNLVSCEGPSFTYIKKGINLEHLDMDFNLAGTMRIVWDFHKTLDIKDTWGNFSLDQTDGEYKEIEISQTDWKIKFINNNTVDLIDSGKVQKSGEISDKIQLKKKNGSYSFYINNQKCWEGILPGNPGVVGIFLDPHSYLNICRFYVAGDQTKCFLFYGYYEALLNSGDQDIDWNFIKSSMFKNGSGAISKENHGFAKWNFYGTGFELYLPKGPSFDTVDIYIDGKNSGKIILKNDQFINSSVVFKSNLMRNGAHSVYIESKNGHLPLDCIKVHF